MLLGTVQHPLSQPKVRVNTVLSAKAASRPALRLAVPCAHHHQWLPLLRLGRNPGLAQLNCDSYNNPEVRTLLVPFTGKQYV